MSVALTDAQRGPPSARCSSATEAAVTSAMSGTVADDPDPGPVADQVKFARLAGPDVAGAAFGCRRCNGDGVGPDGHEGRARAAAVAVATSGAVVEPDSGAGRRSPWSRLSPTMVATHGDRGRAVTSTRGPCWVMRPSSMTTSRSARAAASIGSWVTIKPGAGVATQLLADHLAQLGPGRGIDRGQGLVEEQDGRFGGQRPGQGDSLRLTAGQLFGCRLPTSGSPTRSSQDAAVARASALGRAGGPQPEGDVLQGGEVGEEAVFLEHDRRRRALRGAAGSRRRGPRPRSRRRRCGPARWARARRGPAPGWSCPRRWGRRRRPPPFRRPPGRCRGRGPRGSARSRRSGSRVAEPAVP